MTSRPTGTSRDMGGRWVLDERAHAGGKHFDPGYVEQYDRKARHDPSPEVAYLRTRGLLPASTLVDLGAGTGTFAVAAAPFASRVVAVDISPQMISFARTAAGQDGANIEWVVGGFLTYEHRGEPAEVVYSRNALHHLPDFWKGVALGRIASFVRRGGAFRLRDLVYSFEPDAAKQTIESWIAAAPEDATDAVTREDLETHVRDEFSTFSWLLEPMLERAGFEIVDADYAPSKTYAAYLCRRI